MTAAITTSATVGSQPLKVSKAVKPLPEALYATESAVCPAWMSLKTVAPSPMVIAITTKAIARGIKSPTAKPFLFIWFTCFPPVKSAILIRSLVHKRGIGGVDL